MKKRIILCGKDGRPSMKKVYSMMQGDCELFVRRIPPRNKIPYIRQYKNHVVEQYNRLPILKLNLNNSVGIRWGNRIEVPTDEKTVIYNQIKAINNATNKKIARQILLDKGVNCPKLFDLNNSINDLSYPIIARPYIHSKGKNFVVINNYKEFINHITSNNNWYYSEFIDKTNEYRVHCAHGKILGVMEKPPAHNKIAWNRAINAEPFVRVLQEDYNYNVCLEALKATKELGLDFGGVDVILKNNIAYVLEVNTAPTLNSSEYISNQYSKYFDWLFSSDTRKDHWDFTKFKKAQSFAWKQAQLLNF